METLGAPTIGFDLGLRSLLDEDKFTATLMSIYIRNMAIRTLEGHERPDVVWRERLKHGDEIGRKVLSKVNLGGLT